jgi:hemoglobin/transferrin/lactoferrin receptor protein
VQDYDLAADVYTGDPAFNISLPKRDLRKYGIFYEGTDLTPWLKLLKVDAYRQKVERSFLNDITFPAGPFSMNVGSTSEDEQKMRGLSATATMEFAPGHRTVAGIEYEHDRLISDKTTTTSMVPPVAPVTVANLYSDAKIRTISAFGQHEVDLTGQMTVTGGLRYYNVKTSLDRYVINGVAQAEQENSDSRFLGSLGLTYALGEDTVLRANVSQGYTYASLSELYLTSTGGGGTTLGNPDLKPEKATNYEIGARIDRQNVLLDAVLFYTDSKDYIAAIGTGIPRQSQYRNVDSAKSWGLEVSAEFDPGLWGGMRPYVNLAGVSRKFEFENGYKTRDSGSPRWAGAFGLRGDWTRGTVGGTWDLFLRGESAAKQRDATGTVVDQTGGWATLNFRGNVELTESVALTIEADNLLDKSYRAMDQIDGAGRNLSIFLTATF